MQVPRGFPREGRDVRQVVRFGGNGVLPDAARPLDSLPPGLEDAPVLLPTQGLPLAHDDSRLEERASVIHPCSPSPARPPSGFYGSREEANRAFDQWAATQNGRVKLTVEVDTEGKPVPATVQVLENDSPSATNALVAGILRCRFTPARIGGRPIPAMAVVSQGQTVMRQGEGP
jgi:hypothetical protein